jgi:hypothetical protein
LLVSDDLSFDHKARNDHAAISGNCPNTIYLVC